MYKRVGGLVGGGVYWSRGMGYREGIIGYVYIYIGREEAGRRNLRGGDMTLREYIYIYIYIYKGGGVYTG